jgi:hypothetical protein
VTAVEAPPGRHLDPVTPEECPDTTGDGRDSRAP